MKAADRKIFRNSEDLWNRGSQLIPSGTQTLSKGPGQHARGLSPMYLERGKGCRVHDVDGYEFLDYSMGILPITLGYAYPAVDDAIREQLEKGITFSLMHRLEVEVAEQLVEIIPSAEMVRYGKNGSDVTTAAVRLARAYTGREKIACCGYHGWHDWYIGTTSRQAGVPASTRELTFKFNYNDIASLERIFQNHPGQIAAVIMEPTDLFAPLPGFLEEVRKMTERNGTLLIFDEIKTGFRVAMGGMQEFSKVVPDLSTFGKAIANGMPLSVLAGKKAIMKCFDEVFFSFTFGGEALSLAAALAVINEYKEKSVIDYLWRIGKRLQDGYNRLAKEYGLLDATECLGLAPMNGPVFREKNGISGRELKTYFQQETIKEGILFRDRHNISFSHQDSDIDRTLEVYEEIFGKMRKVLASGDIRAYLEVPVIEEIFPSVPKPKQ